MSVDSKGAKVLYDSRMFKDKNKNKKGHEDSATEEEYFDKMKKFNNSDNNSNNNNNVVQGGGGGIMGFLSNSFSKTFSKGETGGNGKISAKVSQFCLVNVYCYIFLTKLI